VALRQKESLFINYDPSLPRTRFSLISTVHDIWNGKAYIHPKVWSFDFCLKMSIESLFRLGYEYSLACVPFRKAHDSWPKLKSKANCSEFPGSVHLSCALNGVLILVALGDVCQVSDIKGVYSYQESHTDTSKYRYRFEKRQLAYIKKGYIGGLDDTKFVTLSDICARSLRSLNHQ